MRSFWNQLPPLTQGRLLLLTAAILWSSSGAFVKTSTVPATSIAMIRCLAAGIVLLSITLLRKVRLTWEPFMLLMVACFSGMNYFFISSMVRTTAANAIFLQYSAPVWIFLASVLVLHETPDRQNRRALVGAMLGVGILIAGEWTGGQQIGILFGLLSGVTYAGVAVTMRRLRGHDSLWLASLNHLSAGGSLLVVLAASCAMGIMPWRALVLTNPGDLAFLTVFGVCQMALPYVLFGIGLRTVSVQEAALLTLAEPLLNPVWTYLAAGEQPSAYTLAGGGILLGMLVLRYMPPLRRPRQPLGNSAIS